MNNERNRLFIHHDDDPVNSEISNKKAILREKLQFATSLKKPMSDFSLEGLSEAKIYERLLEQYFLDPNGNCPLVSGMYYDNRNKWHIRQEFFFEGKHVDVGYVLDLFSRPNTKIFNKPYMNTMMILWRQLPESTRASISISVVYQSIAYLHRSVVFTLSDYKWTKRKLAFY